MLMLMLIPMMTLMPRKESAEEKKLIHIIFQDVVQSNTVSTARLAGIIKVLANMSDYPVASGQLQLPVVFVVF